MGKEEVKIKILDTIGNMEIISKKLNLNEDIKSFTERNLYYWDGEPKVFPPIDNSNTSKPIVAELFSGLGGTSIGFEMAGFETILGVDIHKPSIQTFRAAHPKAISILGDITKMVKIEGDNSKSLIVKEIKQRIGERQLDVLIAGIPCQGFSLSNSKRHHLDARNYLFLYFVEIAKILNPKVIMIENVSGLRSMSGGKFESDIIEALKLIGYKTHAKILNAADYRVPEKRKRIVFLGTKSEDLIKFPEPLLTEDKYYTVKDALSDLPSLNVGEIKSQYSSAPQTLFQSLMLKTKYFLKNY